MKKLISILVATTMILSLGACDTRSKDEKAWDEYKASLEESRKRSDEKQRKIDELEVLLDKLENAED